MSDQHPLDPYLELVGKVPAEKIAETAGVSLAEVEAWLGESDSSAKGPDSKAEPKPKGKPPAPKPRQAPKPRGPIASIHVVRASAIAIEGPRGRPLRIPIPRSIYRGERARKLAKLLNEDEFRVLSYEE